MNSLATTILRLAVSLLLSVQANSSTVTAAVRQQAITVATQAIQLAEHTLAENGNNAPATAYQSVSPVVTGNTAISNVIQTVSTTSSVASGNILSPAISASAPPTVKYLQKQALVFQVDQGFGNGIIQNEDATGLQRVINTLKAFQSKYEVYVTLSSRQTDKTKLTWALNMLAQNDIPFILEVYASDALSTGVDSVNNPYDIQHGRELSVAQLQQYKNQYGSEFAGVRALEVFAVNGTVLACQQLGVNWCDSFKQYLPTDRFYQKSFLEDYVKFAHQNGMFLLFTDFYWAVYHPWSFDLTVVNQPQNEQDLQDLVKAYPNTVVVAFANNEPLQISMTKMNTWESVVQPYVQYGAKGFGLSDQSWMCTDEINCPASTLSNWASSAFNNGAIIVQTEPYWYWWNFPVGAIGPQNSNYTADQQWANRGYANANLATLANALGVSLPSQNVIATDNSSCGTVSVSSTLSPGQAFTATVTMNNTGNTTWTQNSASNPNPYRLGASDFKQPPYTSSIWGAPYYELPVSSVLPGGSATFTVNATAPTSTGSYTFGWQMFKFGVAWFGSTCQKTVQVAPPLDFTMAPGGSCIIAPVGAGAFTASWPYALPANSFLNIGDDPNYADGYWNKNVSGLTSAGAPDNFYPSTSTLPALQIQPGKTYYVSLYDGGKQYLTPKKAFSLPACSSSNPPPITNARASCPAPGTTATISWTAPLSYNTFFIRVMNTASNTAVVWIDNATGTSYAFSTTPGVAYQWWVHTRDPQTNAPSTPLGTTFTCPTQ